VKLDRVTITGADDRTSTKALVELTEEYPFVEWGILVSKSSEGNPRFPTRDWIEQFVIEMDRLDRARRRNAWLSMHVCGFWVRRLLQGIDTEELYRFRSFPRFQRYQLNFHAEVHRMDWPAFEALADRYFLHRQIIFQMDGTNEALFVRASQSKANVVPLFDRSGGAGVTPQRWPAPFTPNVYQGYAGGLGPGNLPTELPRIAESAGDARIWIDMERNVRSEDDMDLDLDKVRAVLEYCAPYVVQA
jgi:hypothetical protein